MSSQRSRRFLLALFVFAAAVSAALVVSPALTPVTAKQQTLMVDIAEDPTRFVFDKTTVHSDGVSAYGNAFVTQGYIYPEGTIKGSNGSLKDGKPEFPDKVIGEWTCCRQIIYSGWAGRAKAAAPTGGRHRTARCVRSIRRAGGSRHGRGQAAGMGSGSGRR